METDTDIKTVTGANGTFRVGDIVSWRKPPIGTIAPLGVTGCKIILFSETEDGETAALIEAMGQQVGARLSDLHPE